MSPPVRTDFTFDDHNDNSSLEVIVRRLILIVLFWAVSLSCFAQSNFVNAWQKRVRATSSQQPGWAVPVFTPSSGLVQLIRFDAVRQFTPTRATTWNIDGGKGFNFIPLYKTEIDINLPPFLLHRFLGANESKGNYNVSAAIGGSAPTGSYKIGSTDGAISPTVFVGKGLH